MTSVKCVRHLSSPLGCVIFPAVGGMRYLLQIQQQDMDAAGVNLTATVSSTSTLGSTPEASTVVWHDLAPVSSVLIGEH